MSFRFLFQPLRKLSFFKLFLVSLPLLLGSLFLFINPAKLDASDLMQIAWLPGQELIKTGSVYANYPYPLWTVVVMLPFTIWPARVAMLLWFICNVLMLAAGLALFFTLFDWEISPILFALVVCLSALYLPVLTTMWLGQLNIFSFLILCLATYFFLHQKWTRLGIVLGLSFIKPQVMLLLAGLLLLWALWHRRWQTLLGFACVILLLILISIPFISGPAQILGGGIGYHLTTYIKQTSTMWGLCLSLGIPWFVPLAVCLALIIWLGWIWFPALRAEEIPDKQALFLFSAAVLVNLMTVPYSWMHNLVLLLLPFGYSLALILKMKSRQRLGWLALLFIIMSPLAVGLFIALNNSEFVQSYQIIPALVLLPVLFFLETANSGTRRGLSFLISR